MRKYLTILASVAALFGAIACDKNNGKDTDITDDQITLNFRLDYKDTEVKPDAGAAIHLFYDYDFKEGDRDYMVGGTYVKDGKVTLNPDISLLCNDEGKASVKVDRKRPLTIVVESKYHKGKFAELYYSGFEDDDLIVGEFRPKQKRL